LSYDFESRTSTLAEIAMMNNQTILLIDPIKTMQRSYFEALSKKEDNRFSI
jgi:hypothetical protein